MHHFHMRFVIIYFPKVAPHRSHAHLMICSFLFFFFIIVVFIPRPNYSMQCHVYTIYTLLYSNFFGSLHNKLLSVPSTRALARLPFLPTAQDFSFFDNTNSSTLSATFKQIHLFHLQSHER
jgi:hypothetical protein